MYNIIYIYDYVYVFLLLNPSISKWLVILLVGKSQRMSDSSSIPKNPNDRWPSKAVANFWMFTDVHLLWLGYITNITCFFLNLFALWTLLIWYDWTSEIVQTRLSCSKNTHTSSLLNLHHLPVSNYYRDGNIQDIPWMVHGSSFSGHNTFF